MVVKTVALSGSALVLIAFTALWASPLASLLAGAMYFALTAGAYSSEGYSIYYTNDFLMVLGWFAAVYAIAREASTSGRRRSRSWPSGPRRRSLLVPLLVGLAWWQRKAGARAWLLTPPRF